MGVRRKKGEKDAIDVPMSAMIDVVFLLLIYFIVTYKEEIPEAHLQVNLPQPNPPPVEQKEDPPPLLNIEIHPGQYLLEGSPMSLNRLHSYLKKMAATDPTVIIKVNQRAKTKNLIGVLDICKDVELSSLNVVTLN